MMMGVSLSEDGNCNTAFAVRDVEHRRQLEVYIIDDMHRDYITEFLIYINKERRTFGIRIRSVAWSKLH